MDPKRAIEKLEHDLSHYMISEMCKNNPEKRGKPEMYKYKGLTLKVDPKSKALEKTMAVRIGALEAEFKIDTCEKNSGCLAPEEEHVIKIWLGQSENNYLLKSIFATSKKVNELKIIPFDLEHLLN